MKTIEVVAAVIQCGDKILCVRRGIAKFDYLSGKWEFPGGKIEKNESQHQAIEREIWEELNMQIAVIEKFMVVEHAYPDFHLTMHVFRCSSHDKPTLLEHQTFMWLGQDDLSQLDWAAADIPVVQMINTMNDEGRLL